MCVCMNVYVYTRNAGAFGGMAGGSMSHVSGREGEE